MEQAQLTRDPGQRGRSVRRRDLLPRAGAAAAALFVAVGAVTMTVALVAAPGPWTAGYVSEAGTAGMPAATAYRSGLLLLATGVVTLGAALRAVARQVAPPGVSAPARSTDPPASQSLPQGFARAAARLAAVDRSAPLARVAGLLLILAGVLAGMSGTVPCSARCPLPPFEAATAADLVHSAASILGMAALAFAMVAVALAPLRAHLRLWAAGGAAATFPLAAVMAFAMLFVGRAPLTTIAERIMLAVTVTWLLGAAVLTSRPPR